MTNIIQKGSNSKNTIVVYEDYAEVILENKEGIEVARVLIDIEDIDLVKQYRWRASNYNKPYARCGINKNKTIQMHRLIMKPENGLVVDHINHNRLDNRKSNLRVCTYSQNAMNRGNLAGNKDKGIFKLKDVNRKRPYQVMIKVNGIRIVKYASTYEEALLLRQELEAIYFKEYRFVS